MNNHCQQANTAYISNMRDISDENGDSFANIKSWQEPEHKVTSLIEWHPLSSLKEISFFLCHLYQYSQKLVITKIAIVFNCDCPENSGKIL